MQPVTIPKRLSQRGDLVVIPRKEYEELLSTKKQKSSRVARHKKSSQRPDLKDFPKVSQAEKDKHPKFYAKLDRDLAKAMEDYQAGKFFGPFRNLEESREFLRSRRAKKQK